MDRNETGMDRNGTEWTGINRNKPEWTWMIPKWIGMRPEWTGMRFISQNTLMWATGFHKTFLRVLVCCGLGGMKSLLQWYSWLFWVPVVLESSHFSKRSVRGGYGYVESVTHDINWFCIIAYSLAELKKLKIRVAPRVAHEMNIIHYISNISTCVWMEQFAFFTLWDTIEMLLHNLTPSVSKMLSMSFLDNIRVLCLSTDKWFIRGNSLLFSHVRASTLGRDICDPKCNSNS